MSDLILPHGLVEELRKEAVLARLKKLEVSLVKSFGVPSRHLTIEEDPNYDYQLSIKRSDTAAWYHVATILLDKGMTESSFCSILAMWYTGNIDPKFILGYFTYPTQALIQNINRCNMVPDKSAIADAIPIEYPEGPPPK